MNTRKKDKGKNAQHIQAFIRIRPPTTDDTKNSSKIIYSEKDLEVHLAHGSKSYNFDKVFDTRAKQNTVYNNIIAPLLGDIMQGYNCTVFAYGQSGTGKSFTLLGNSSPLSTNFNNDTDSGIIPRVLYHLFYEFEKNPEIEFTIRVSFFELYNEVLTDLLSQESEDKTLKIYEDQRSKGNVQIHGLEEVTVYDEHQILEILERANEKKLSLNASMNTQPSRSHTVFTITLHIRETTCEGEELVKTGKLQVVDLAGSESISKTSCNKGKESATINQSLLTLGRVIHALVEKNGHVPYRESKLTRILQDSLGCKTKTCIIGTISPGASNIEETVSTLDFVFKAKHIINNPEVNRKMSKEELIHKYIEEREKIKRDVQAASNRIGIYMDPSNYNNLVKEQQRNREEYLKAVEECSIFEGRIMELERIRIELNELNVATQSDLSETVDSLTKTKENLYKLRKKRHVTQEIIDRYDEAQTILSDQTKTLSNHLGKYMMEHQKLHDKVTNLYSSMDSAEKTSENLMGNFQKDQEGIYEKFNTLMNQTESEFTEINSIVIDMHAANKKIISDYLNNQEFLKINTKLTEKCIYKAMVTIDETIKTWDVRDDETHKSLICRVNSINERTTKMISKSGRNIKLKLDQFNIRLHEHKCLVATIYESAQTILKSTIENVKRHLQALRNNCNTEYETYIQDLKLLHSDDELSTAIDDFEKQMNGNFDEMQTDIAQKIIRMHKSLNGTNDNLGSLLSVIKGRINDSIIHHENAVELMKNNTSAIKAQVHTFIQMKDECIDSAQEATDSSLKANKNHLNDCHSAKEDLQDRSDGYNMIENELQHFTDDLNALSKEKSAVALHCLSSLATASTKLSSNCHQQSVKCSNHLVCCKETLNDLHNKSILQLNKPQGNLSEMEGIHKNLIEKAEFTVEEYVESLIPPKRRIDSPAVKHYKSAIQLPENIHVNLMDCSLNNTFSDDDGLNSTLNETVSEGDAEEIFTPVT